MALLNVGDILIFDTKTFHYGSANTSDEARAMLCFSFQDCSGADRPLQKAFGFTYHIDQSTLDRGFLLSDFDQVNSSQCVTNV